jgi:hypothetical protein
MQWITMIYINFIKEEKWMLAAYPRWLHIIDVETFCFSVHLLIQYIEKIFDL